MKNQGSWTLVIITLTFLGFTCGLFLGRNGLRGSDIQISTSATAGTQPSAPAQTVPSETASSSTLNPGLVNINDADVLSLSTLPGVGSVLAQRIIDYRTENGPFSTIEDLAKVQGIGEKRIEQLRPQITVGGT